MLYHPGKVYKIISPKKKDVKGDNSVQATVEMWDGNVFTFTVSDGLEKDIETGDVVLVDYSPSGASKVPVPSHNIIKVIKGEEGDDLWRTYKKFHEKKSKKSQTSQSFQPSYMG